jgi:hypothetical protein
MKLPPPHRPRRRELLPSRLAGLSKGWELYGPPALTYDPEQRRVICGQAIVKEVEGKSYSPDLELSAQ